MNEKYDVESMASAVARIQACSVYDDPGAPERIRDTVGAMFARGEQHVEEALAQQAIHATTEEKACFFVALMYVAMRQGRLSDETIDLAIATCTDASLPEMLRRCAWYAVNAVPIYNLDPDRRAQMLAVANRIMRDSQGDPDKALFDSAQYYQSWMSRCLEAEADLRAGRIVIPSSILDLAGHRPESADYRLDLFGFSSQTRGQWELALACTTRSITQAMIDRGQGKCQVAETIVGPSGHRAAVELVWRVYRSGRDMREFRYVLEQVKYAYAV